MLGDFVPTDYWTLEQLFPQYAQNSLTKAYYVKAFLGYQFNDSQHTSTRQKPQRYAYTVLREGSPDMATTSGQDVELGQYNRYVVLCPDAFLLSQALGQLHSFPSLAEAVSSEKYPDGNGQALDRYVPLSATLYQ
ncbi:hypothetical protein F5Y09DRAFT_340845 [Xylaria sp. FL1042]|nr:hypothetical protein F5Y09DRAFT_340845 [Xylaria sp. FL1042]